MPRAALREAAATLLPLFLALTAVLPEAEAALHAEAAATPSATWAAGTVVEPESVEEIAVALTTDAAGFTLAVGREPGASRALGILRLPPPDQDFLDDARSLRLRIDGGPSFEPRRLGGGLKSSTFLLWDGVGEPVVGPLRDLMEARETIAIEYPLAGGGHKEVAFAPDGVKAAIATVLGVAAEVTPEARALAAGRQEAIERCLGAAKPKDRDRCLERLASCAAATTADDLRACLAGAKK